MQPSSSPHPRYCLATLTRPHRLVVGRACVLLVSLPAANQERSLGRNSCGRERLPPSRKPGAARGPRLKLGRPPVAEASWCDCASLRQVPSPPAGAGREHPPGGACRPRRWLPASLGRGGVHGMNQCFFFFRESPAGKDGLGTSAQSRRHLRPRSPAVRAQPGDCPAAVTTSAVNNSSHRCWVVLAHPWSGRLSLSLQCSQGQAASACLPLLLSFSVPRAVFLTPSRRPSLLCPSWSLNSWQGLTAGTSRGSEGPQ